MIAAAGPRGAVPRGVAPALARAVIALAALATAAAPVVALADRSSSVAQGQAGDPEAAPVRTAKERLSGKAADEQRIDNCKVPPELRGAKPRPADCDASRAPAMSGRGDFFDERGGAGAGSAPRPVVPRER